VPRTEARRPDVSPAVSDLTSEIAAKRSPAQSATRERFAAKAPVDPRRDGT
jgi:hypothetical protein